MKMIYIPPFKMLEQSLNYPMHLMLPHLDWNEEYVRHFHKAKRLGKYVIMDNGANEGQDIPFTKLVASAYNFRVDELVLPDVMGNPKATYDRVRDFMQLRSRLPVNIKLGYVLHGNSMLDTCNTYNELLLNRELYNAIDVLYIPRRLVSLDDKNARIKVASHIRETERLPKKIHFLGASPLFIDEAKNAKRLGMSAAIRSMDTSAPYVYALRDEYVDGGKKLSRNHNTYFSGPVTPGQRIIAIRNCMLMDEWANAKAPVSQL